MTPDPERLFPGCTHRVSILQDSWKDSILCACILVYMYTKYIPLYPIKKQKFPFEDEPSYPKVDYTLKTACSQ